MWCICCLPWKPVILHGLTSDYSGTVCRVFMFSVAVLPCLLLLLLSIVLSTVCRECNTTICFVFLFGFFGGVRCTVCMCVGRYCAHLIPGIFVVEPPRTRVASPRSRTIRKHILRGSRLSGKYAVLKQGLVAKPLVHTNSINYEYLNTY